MGMFIFGAVLLFLNSYFLGRNLNVLANTVGSTGALVANIVWVLISLAGVVAAVFVVAAGLASL